MRYSIYRIDPSRATAGDHTPQCVFTGEMPMVISELRDSWVPIDDAINARKITKPGTYAIIWQHAGLYIRVYEVREHRQPLEVVR